jgi:predicted MFS family arabinose efflux permease
MLNVVLIDVGFTYGIGIATAQWSVTLYLLIIASILPLMGKLGDMKGRRVIHNTGFILFAVGSGCCALSPTYGLFLLSRIVQGAGAAMYQAMNMALVVKLAAPENRGRAIGIVSSFVAAGTIAGPSLGGIVVQWFHWKAAFWFLSGIAFLLWLSAQYTIPKDVDEARAGSSEHLDIVGASIFAVILGSLAFTLNYGSGASGSLLMLGLPMVILIVSLLIFGRWIHPSRWYHRSGQPFLPAELLANRPFVLGCITSTASYLSVFSTQVVMPSFLRLELDLAPAVAGLIMMSHPAALIVIAPLAGEAVDRFGASRVLMIGLAMMGSVLIMLGFLNEHTPVWLIVIWLLWLGSSTGMFTSPNNSMTLAAVEESQSGFAASMMALSRNIGMMLGAVIGGTLGILAHHVMFGITAGMIFTMLILQILMSKRDKAKLRYRLK